MRNKLEKLMKLNKRGKVEKKPFIVGLCRPIGADKHVKPTLLEMKEVERAGHFGCFGTTRIGKTSFMTHLSTQDIHSGNNVVVIDPKGDWFLFSHIVQAAVESGRLNDLMVITPIYPEHSLKIDPLSHYYMPDELVDHVVSAIRAREEYFINVASEITTVVVLSLIALARSRGERARMNFYEIKQRITQERLTQLKSAIEPLLTHPDEDVKKLVEDVVEAVDQVLRSPADFFAKVTSSLRTTLTALTSSTTGKIIGKATTNEFVKRFEEGRGVILYCNTGNLLARRTANITGRVLLSMIHSTVGRFFASGRKLNPPLCLYIDEGHNVLYRGIQELFNKGGGAGVYIHFFTQSVAQMEDEIGADACQSILDNMNTQVFMRGNHEKTARFVEESTPLKKIQQPILSLSGGRMSMSLREIEERTVLKQKVLQLPPRWFYMKKEGRIYKGRTIDMEEPWLRVQFPLISGERR